MTAQHHRGALLRDLESVRKVGIKVVFTIERGDGLDVAAQGESQTRGELDGLGVDGRKGSGQSGVEWGDVGVDARAISSFRPAR